MRIEAYTQVQQLYNNKNTNKVKKQNTQSFSDQLQISSMGKDIQIAKAAVAGSPDVREDMTASIKSRVDAGTYSVDSESFAQKLFERYNSTI